LDVNFLMENWSLVAIALASGGMLLWPVVSRGMGAGLTPTAAVQLINREKAVVVDVSEAEEFATGHASALCKEHAAGTTGGKAGSCGQEQGSAADPGVSAGARANRAVAVAKQAGLRERAVLTVAG
jgi:rhodanese-related sulfurtransferase